MHRRRIEQLAGYRVRVKTVLLPCDPHEVVPKVQGYLLGCFLALQSVLDHLEELSHGSHGCAATIRSGGKEMRLTHRGQLLLDDLGSDTKRFKALVYCR